jgi:hypothetical protein
MRMRSHPCLLALVVASSLAACGGSTQSDNPAQDSGGPSPDEGVPADTTPPPGDTGAPTDPLTGAAETWTWNDVAGTQCANGSQTGVGVNITTKSKKVLVFLMGGGACWNALTCSTGRAANLDGYGKGNFDTDIKSLSSAGLFDRNDTNNPFKDYSFVFVPYCTGDVHAGNKVSTYGAAGTFHHVGFVNVGADLARIVPTFPGAESVVLAGSSAGGFGALWNFVQVQTAFGSIHVDVVDDAGPPLRPPYMSTALQNQWTAAWALDTTLPSDCTKCNATDGYHNAVPYLATKYPGHRVSLDSSLQDSTIRGFFGITADQMQAGLLDFQTNVLPSAPDWRVFYVTGSKHTFLGDPLGNTVTNGTSLGTYLTQMISGDASWASVTP